VHARSARPEAFRRPSRSPQHPFSVRCKSIVSHCRISLSTRARVSALFKSPIPKS
jgi:hypothetical protein